MMGCGGGSLQPPANPPAQANPPPAAQEGESGGERALSARLQITDDVVGRVTVFDERGSQLLDIHKSPGSNLDIGLEPGRYRVQVDGGEKGLRSGEIAAGEGEAVAISAADLPVQSTARREVATAVMLAPPVPPANTEPATVHHFALGFVPYSDHLEGTSLGLAASVVGSGFRGAQIAGGANLSYGPGQGLQLAGLANLASEDVRGAQMSAFLNVGKHNVSGLQLALVNYVGGRSDGAQFSAVNVAQQEHGGLQAGAVNVAGIGRGLQLGIVNVADEVRGSQIGIIDLANESDGISLALFPIIRKGYWRATTWASDVTFTNAGIKLGASHNYTLWGVGVSWSDRALHENYIVPQFGLGAHITPTGWPVFFDTDIIASAWGLGSGVSELSGVLTTLRVSVGLPIDGRLALVGGPTFNVMTSWNGHDYQPGLGFGESVQQGSATVRAFPGLTLGLQL